MNVIDIINTRIQHHALHNEEGKHTRIDELKILKLIIKDREEIEK
jgi:hypothetical protein